MPGTSFTLRNVKGGQPFAAEDVPSLPPRALLTMLEIAGKETEVGTVQSVLDLEFRCVHMALRRLEPGLTLQQLLDDEDVDEVLAIARVIRDRHPKLFPQPSAAPASGVPEHPKSEPPA